MTIIECSTRIQAALVANKISQEQAQAANQAIRQAKHYGNSMTPKARDSLLTNRFGI